MTDRSTDRMGQNAAALVASSAITATLGLVFWVVAARLLPTAEVGTGTALVTSIVLLGNLSTLGLRNGLVRFIAPAGRLAGRFITRSYVLCAGVAVVVAFAFAVGTPLWADELTDLRDDPRATLAFCVATAAWTVFVLQDNVLTGLRRAVWVPVENLGYSLLKLGMLVALVSTGALALPLAWSLPALGLIVPVNVLVFRRLLPQQPAAPPDPAIFTRSAIARFSIGDHAADVIRMVGVEVIVLVVLATRGPEETAYVFFAITIAATGQLVSSNIVTAFLAEAAARPGESDALARRAGINIARLIVPGALFGAIVAPFVLRVFGTEYADKGGGLLALLAIDAIPLALAALATGWARLQRDVRTIVGVAVGVAAAPLFGALVLAPNMGIIGIGWSALVGHCFLAAALATTTLRPVLQGSSGAVVSWLGARRGDVRHRRRARAAAAVLDELDATLLDELALEPRRLVRSDNDTAIVRVEDPDSPRIVKIALSDDAGQGLRRHAAALDALRSLTGGVGQVGSVVPMLLAAGRHAGHDYVIETMCPGRQPLAADHDTLAAVAAGVAELHALSAAPGHADRAVVDALVTAPVDVLRADERLTAKRSQIERLHGVLFDALEGRRLVTARTHGDCWLGNSLVRHGPSGVELTGLIDWEDSRAHGLPDVDLAHLWLAAQGEHIGRSTVAALRRARPPRPFADLGVAAPNPLLPVEVPLLLAWLDHVAAGLRRASRFPLGRVWLANNVEPVLRAVGELDTGGWCDRHMPAPGEISNVVVAHAR